MEGEAEVGEVRRMREIKDLAGIAQSQRRESLRRG